jgi:hypothetical protein
MEICLFSCGVGILPALNWAGKMPTPQELESDTNNFWAV